MTQLKIIGAGLCCPLGLALAPAYSAIRAGIRRFATGGYCGRGGEPIVVSMVSHLPSNSPRWERVVALMSGAVADAVRGIGVADFAGVPLVVGLAEPERSSDARTLVDALHSRLGELGLRFDRGAVRAVASGGTTGARALAEASRGLERSASRACVVVCGDSLVDAAALGQLEREDRLKSERQPDGVIPGEAAAAVVVTDRTVAGLGAVRGVGFATEPATRDNEEPLRATGLIAAVRAALEEARLDLADIDVRISDTGGESFAFKEQALLVARLLRVRRERFELWLPAESLGDTGAAGALVGLVLGIEAMRRGRASARALVCASDPRGERGAVVVTGAAV